MPQGNDFKDAKDIDPLGMTRDLFGAHRAEVDAGSAMPNDAAAEFEDAGQDPQVGEHHEAPNEGTEAITDEPNETAPESASENDHYEETWDEPSDEVEVAEMIAEDDARLSSLKEEMTRELRTLLDDLGEPAESGSVADPSDSAQRDPNANLPSP